MGLLDEPALPQVSRNVEIVRIEARLLWSG
jgi:hypothetical protein